MTGLLQTTSSSPSLRTLVSPFLQPGEIEGIAPFEEAFQEKVEEQQRESDARLIQILQQRLHTGKSSVVYIGNGPGRMPAELGATLGSGGSKKAVQLGSRFALLVPNIQSKEAAAGVARWWRSLVDEEVSMTDRFASHGLMTLSSKRVDVYPSSAPSEMGLPAYISESFDSLAATKGCYILDMNGSNSTWKLGKDYLFATDEERLKEENWDRVLDELLTDVAKICLYDLPGNGDTMNMAIIKKDPCEVRYLGFDFTDKELMSLFKLEGPVDFRVLEAKAFMYMYRMLKELIAYEFGASDKGEALFNRLIAKYPKIIAQRMQKMRADS